MSHELRWNPWEQLERFEAKHGDHSTLNSQWMEVAAGNEAKAEAHNRNLRILLREHNKLVWTCMGYSAGLSQGRAGK